MTTALNLATFANFLDTNSALPLNGSGTSSILPTAKGGTGINYTPVAADLNKVITVTSSGGATPTYGFSINRPQVSTLGSSNTDGSFAPMGNIATADGSGNVTWASPSVPGGVGVAIPNVSFVSSSAGVNRTFASGIFAFYNSASAMTVAWNGVVLVPIEDYSFTAPSGANLGFITLLVSVNVGDSIEVTPSFQSFQPIPSFKINLTQAQATVTDGLFFLYNSVLDLTITINGVVLVPGEDFGLLGNTVTLYYSATAGDVFLVLPSSAPGRESVPVWTSPLFIPINGFVVAASPTFTQPGGTYNGSLTLLQGTSTATVSGVWLNLGALAATGNASVWIRLT